MKTQTKKPNAKKPTAPKNAPFAVLTTGGNVRSLILNKEGKALIAEHQAVKLDEVADFASAVKDGKPAYMLIKYEHELTNIARITKFNLKWAFDSYIAYEHAVKHNYKFPTNAVVFLFLDTAPIFETTTKDGSKRYYQNGKRISAETFDFYCCNDSIKHLEIAKQTKQAYAKPYRGDKKQVTKSTLASIANIVLTAGYCQLQALLNPLSPSVYHANTYGWQADGYLITPNLAVTTGYSIVGTHKIPPHLALIAERKAMTANANLSQSHDEHMGKLANILADLITDTLAYHQCCFG